MGISHSEACSAAADIYSAGVLLAEVVTGLVPFPAVGAVDGGVARRQTDNAEYRLSAMQEAKHQAWVSCFFCFFIELLLTVCLSAYIECAHAISAWVHKYGDRWWPRGLTSGTRQSGS